MEIMPLEYKVERMYQLPVLRITGVIQPSPGIEKVLITSALNIIQFLEEKFDGKIMGLSEKDVEDIPKNKYAVRFYMIFKNEDEVEKAIQGMKGGLG